MGVLTAADLNDARRVVHARLFGRGDRAFADLRRAGDVAVTRLVGVRRQVFALTILTGDLSCLFRTIQRKQGNRWIRTLKKVSPGNLLDGRRGQIC